MSGERGSASVAAVALISVIVALTVGAAEYGAAVIARHRAQTAADLAALAAAGALAGGREMACGRASEITAAMRAALADCRVEGLDIVVTVDVRVALRVPGLAVAGPARSTARAGPASEAP
ncbi:secretion/DNA translocation related TadE-like protein [Mycobacterium sp. MAA66]|uniref:Rv3654c family TadE-like protein n=1 Tax=Mycobacterium sp. MAA66 TaxID=3156297 RepID=UPI003516BC31